MENQDRTTVEASTQGAQGRGFLIPLEIILRAGKEGIGIERLQEMVRLSARCTHARGNRRFESVVFMVVGKRVVNFSHIEEETKPEVPEVYHRCNICKDTGKVRVFDQCEHCDGMGCSKCDQGLTPGTIPCPMCEQKERLKAWRY